MTRFNSRAWVVLAVAASLSFTTAPVRAEDGQMHVADCAYCQYQYGEQHPTVPFFYWVTVDIDGPCDGFGENCVQCETVWLGELDCPGPDSYSGWGFDTDDYWEFWCGELCTDPGLAKQVSLAISALEQSDHAAFDDILSASSGKMFFNHERGALQVVGCDGNIAIHLPIYHKFGMAGMASSSPDFTASIRVGRAPSPPPGSLAVY